jgi:hypothetical protein
MVQVLHPPQKFDPQPCYNALIYGTKNYRIMIPFNRITAI